MDLMFKLMQTESSWALFIIRIGLGAVILPHGAQKLLGMFGGYGFYGTMDFFTKNMNLPWILAFLVIIGTFFGGIALIFGFGTRFVALSIGIIMFFAMVLVHFENGFFMNWFGNQKGEGIEFFLLAISMSVALGISGGGNLSLDKLISENR